MKPNKNNLKVQYLKIGELKAADYNPRKWTESAIENLKESIKRFGMVDPLIINKAPNRKNVVIGGHFRLKIAKDLGFKSVPVIYVNIPEIEKEKELNLRLNKNTGEWDFKLLAEFDESFLSDIGFSSEDLDEVFDIDPTPEEFDLEKELRKLKIYQIKFKKGDIYQLGNHRLGCGNSTKSSDISKLMGGQKADMCFTDPRGFFEGKKRFEFLKIKIAI